MDQNAKGEICPAHCSAVGCPQAYSNSNVPWIPKGRPCSCQGYNYGCSAKEMQSELHLGKEEEPQVAQVWKPSSQGEEPVQRGGCMEELENGVYQELEPKNWAR